jgi:hypothetical protein
MQVSDLKAEPNERGGRIDLSWLNPTDGGFAGVKVLRRASAYPDTSPDSVSRWLVHDEPAAATPAGLAAIFVDEPLQGETVYYYTVVPYNAASQLQAPSFASAMATSPYQTAAHLYDSLPGLYRNFDTILPPAAPGLDAQESARGQLRRLVEMFGLEFDVLRSFAAGVRNFYDVGRVDGVLLPLLAEWAGWHTNTSLDYDKQRNEIRYAPHFYRTAGVPANTRATINRLVTWDARLKEFVHNVFLASHPEQLTLWESVHSDGAWRAAQTVTLDIAYEGRPSALQTRDTRQWLFYHARQSAPRNAAAAQPAPTPTHLAAQGEDQWHIFFKSFDEYGWASSRRVEAAGTVNKYPSVVQDQRGNIWLFWSAYTKSGGRFIPRIKLRLMSFGKERRPPRLKGLLAGPFALADGDTFTITVNDTTGIFSKQVIFFADAFQDVTHASAREVADYLNRELQRVDVTVDEDDMLVVTPTSPTAGSMSLVGSAVPKLGLPGVGAAKLAVAARLIGQTFEPFHLASGQTITLRVDGDRFRTVTFNTNNVPNLANATAASVAAAINETLPGAAQVVNTLGQNHIEFASHTTGGDSLVDLDVDASTAASALGFGARLPTLAVRVPPDDAEPAAFVDSAGGVWLFWSSRRDGSWKIWYNRFNVATSSWGTAKMLTPGVTADREPSVVFDPAGTGRNWVFWARKKSNGLWNVFISTTANMNFPTLGVADWIESELLVVPADYDNREPFGILQGAGNVELFFTSNRSHGWHVWSKGITTVGQGAEAQITDGQFSRRAPVVLANAGRMKLYFRSNESLHYTSSFYPSAETIDARYSGSTSVDTRNRLKISLRLNIQDAQRYTYDTLKGRDNWYARDTVGVYLKPDTPDQALVVRRRDQMEAVLQGFLPMQVRPIFIIDLVISEYFYTYDDASAAPPTVIGERVVDTILSEVFRDTADQHVSDTADFFWLRTFDAAHIKPALPDMSVTPHDLSFRLPIGGVGEP